MNQVADTCTMILKKFLADPMIPKPKSCLFTSFYSTGHGAYLTGRAAAQLMIRTVKDASNYGGETTYNLQDASVSDLSAWLQEVSCGEKNLEDYRAKTSNSRPRRDDGHFVTPSYPSHSVQSVLDEKELKVCSS